MQISISASFAGVDAIVLFGNGLNPPRGHVRLELYALCDIDTAIISLAELRTVFALPSTTAPLFAEALLPVWVTAQTKTAHESTRSPRLFYHQ
jgi:hypothetical protein